MMMAEKMAGNGSEKTTLNLSVTVEDKKFLKMYAVQNGTTISDMLHSYVETLKVEGAGERDETK